MSEQGITRPATIPPPPPPTSPPQSDRQKTKIYPDLTNFEENSHVDEVGSCEYPLEVEVATVSRHHGVSQTCCFVGIIEDYDRMIRIILLTTISCTHLDIVHSSQYV